MFIFRLCPRGVLFITWICHFNLINTRRRETDIEKCVKPCTMLQLTGTMDCYKNGALFSALLCSFYPIPQTLESLIHSSVMLVAECAHSGIKQHPSLGSVRHIWETDKHRVGICAAQSREEDEVTSPILEWGTQSRKTQLTLEV